MSANKRFFLTDIKPLLTGWNDPEGCLVPDSIMVDGQKVGYMYRDEPENGYDSGWCFFAENDDDEYANNPDNLGIYSLNTVCNYDPDIIPFLHAPYGSAFARDENGVFVPVDFESTEDT